MKYYFYFSNIFSLLSIFLILNKWGTLNPIRLTTMRRRDCQTEIRFPNQCINRAVQINIHPPRI
jgi:hypothetical protein